MGISSFFFSAREKITLVEGLVVEARGRAAREGGGRRWMVVRDVTERKRAEEAVGRSQKTVAELIERSPFGTYVVDSQFRIAMMNAASQEGAFRNVRPIIGRDFSEAMRTLWPEPVAAEIIGHFRHTLETGERYYSRRFVNPRHDVEIVEAYEWELHRMTLPDGQHGVICYYYDSTKLRQAETAVRESEERLRLALEAGDFGTWDLDLVTGQALRSLRHDQMFGYQKLQAEWSVEAALAHVLPEDRQKVQEAHTLVPGKTRISFEARLRRSDGTNGWVMSAGRIQHDDQGRPIRVVGVCADITERKRAEAAVRESEERFRSYFELGLVGMAVTSPTKGWVEVNDELCRILGYERSELLQKTWAELTHPDDLGADVAQFNRLLAGEIDGYTLDKRFIHKDGRTVDTTLSGKCVRRADGSVDYAVALVQDITERKRAEEKLRESEQKYRDLVESANSIIIRMDRAGKMSFFNKYAQKFFGYSLDEALGQNVKMLVPSTESHSGRRLEEMADTILSDPDDFSENINENVLKSGEHVWISWRNKAIRDASGNIVGNLAIGQDITERKHAEEMIKASLGEKEVLLKEIHHRVKNNLQVITSLVDMQTRALGDPALRGLFQDVRDRVRSMALVHEKLYQSESLASVDFADYTRSLIGFLSRAHSPAETTVRLKLDLKAVSLPVERAVPCGLILNELVTNAFKHAFRGRAQGEMTAALGTGPDGRVWLRVSDDGVGLPAGLDWRQSRSLGLQLVHLLAGQLDAMVEVRTEGGTEFEIAFEAGKDGERGA